MEDALAPPPIFKDRVQLGRLSITHDAVMDWLLANPGKGQMRACAEYFGFTRAWLSSMIWSDAFQAKLRDKKEKLFDETVIPLRDQMNGVAQRAIERLGEKVEEVEDPKLLVDVADKMLHRLGYAPKVDVNPAATSNTQNNFYGVSPELLAQARKNAEKGNTLTQSGGNQAAIPSPEGIQANATSDLGEASVGAPGLCNEETQG